MAKPTYKLSNGTRKHIREEKARIRREVLDLKEQDRQIDELYKRFETTLVGSAK